MQEKGSKLNEVDIFSIIGDEVTLYDDDPPNGLMNQKDRESSDCNHKMATSDFSATVVKDLAESPTRTVSYNMGMETMHMTYIPYSSLTHTPNTSGSELITDAHTVI